MTRPPATPGVWWRRSGPEAGDPVHYGWVVAAAAFSVLFLTYGVQYTFGLFFDALAAEFGWSRASLSGVFSLYAGAYSFLGLVTGRLTDRWGPRRVVAAGGVLLGSGLALSSLAHSLLPLYGTYLVAAGGMSTAFVPCTTTVVRWFAARRGLAVGLAITGAGVGIFVCPPLVALLIAGVGWRAAYVTLGATMLVALVGLSRLLVRDPGALGLQPYGGAPPGGEPAGPLPAPALASMLRHPSFLALVGVYMATWMPVFLVPVHLVPLARDLGLAPVAGATALSVLGLGSLAGRFAMGALSDLIGRRPALALSLALQVASFGALALAGGPGSLFLAAAAYGYAYGAITALMPAIVGDFFGPTHAGTLVGVIFGVAGPTSALGPLLGGLAFDATGSYAWALGTAGALNAVGLALLALARRPASDGVLDWRP